MRSFVRNARYWGPLVAGFMCLVIALFAGPLVTWILLLAAFALIFDGATAIFARAAGTGGLTAHRQ